MIRSTKAQLEEFKKSFIWQDIVDELTNMSKLAMLEYDVVGEAVIDDEGFKKTPSTGETLIHLGDIKGRRKAVNYFLSIPDILINILEDKKHDTGRE